MFRPKAFGHRAIGSLMIGGLLALPAAATAADAPLARAAQDHDQAASDESDSVIIEVNPDHVFTWGPD